MPHPKPGADPDLAPLLRVFFALWPDADARQSARRARARTSRTREGEGASRLNLHVTVAFIGEVDAERIDALRGILAAHRLRQTCRPSCLTLDRAGTFRGTGIGVGGSAL